MNKIQIYSKGECHGYKSLIETHLIKELPQIHVENNNTLVDVLTDVLYNTKNIRYGAIPPVESQVVLRDVLRKYIQNDLPIPILVPWGSIKADFSAQVDIAEVSAIQTLVNLNNQVKQYYPKGLDISIRLEDTSGFRLFSMEDNYQQIVINSKSYVEDMNTLVQLLSNYSITVMPESQMENSHLFNDYEKKNSELIFNYLVRTKNSTNLSEDIKELKEYAQLLEAGWKGIISHEQREHYLSSYRKLYKDYNENRLLERLSLYLGGALTRFQLNINGNKDEWDMGYLKVSFIPPVKGNPEGYNYNYMYYRTVSMNQARTHLAPWRAKGYLRIQGGAISTKLSTFGEDIELIANTVSLYNNVSAVNVRADFLLL